MKKLAIILGSVALATSTFGQGALVFNNRVVGSLIAPVYGVNLDAPGVRLSGNAATNATGAGSVDYTGNRTLVIGTGYTAELWAGLAANGSAGLAPIAVNGKTTFRTTTVSGFWTAPAADAVIPFVTADGIASIYQVRVWDNNGGQINTWAAAMAGGRASGASDIVPIVLGLAPPAASSLLVGLTSFNLTIVPEPGVIALGVLGLGALLLRRRK